MELALRVQVFQALEHFAEDDGDLHLVEIAGLHQVQRRTAAQVLHNDPQLRLLREKQKHLELKTLLTGRRRNRLWGRIRSNEWRRDCRTATGPWSLAGCLRFHLRPLQDRLSWWPQSAASGCRSLWKLRQTILCQSAPVSWRSIRDPLSAKENKRELKRLSHYSSNQSSKVPVSSRQTPIKTGQIPHCVWRHNGICLLLLRASTTRGSSWSMLDTHGNGERDTI